MSSNSGEELELGYGSDDEDDYEEIDFGYAATVVAETWELFAEADDEQQVRRRGRLLCGVRR
jgi:hypothetical protein